MGKAMTRIAGFGLAALLLLLCATLVQGEEIDLATGQPYVPGQTTTLYQAPQGPMDYNVLWDLTHGVFLSYEPAGVFSGLVALLGTEGFSVTTSNAGIDHIDLAPYAVIVICIGGAWNSPYTASEVAAITQFVDNGGGVLVMAENTECPNHNINPITEALGTTCGVSYLSPSELVFSNFAAIDIFAGVGSIRYLAAGELSGSAPSAEVAWESSGKATVTMAGSCKMIVTGDMNFCDDRFRSMDGNQTFIVNVFKCLASNKETECVPALISPVEGAILDNGCVDRTDGIDWDFDWVACEGATNYHLYVKHPGAEIPVIDDPNVGSPSYSYSCPGCYISDDNRLGWQWRVRAMVGGVWGPWSDERSFDVEPLDTDCGACDQPILSLLGYRTVSWADPLWTVQVEVRDAGPGVARNVAVTMNEDLAWLTIPDPNCAYGDIAVDASSWGNDSYTFDLTNHPGGSFNVWFDVAYEDDCGNHYRVRLDPEFDRDVAGSEPMLTYGLGQNYPNPFNPSTMISFQLVAAGRVSLSVFDVTGKLVRTLVSGDRSAGLNAVSWDGKDNNGVSVTSGIYFYKIQAGSFTETKKMVLIR